MTTKTEKSIVAIPTVYKGIQLKSRMEAQCAVLFDKLGWEWEYEPFSLMLPSGVTYIPDFYIGGNVCGVVECRGYENTRGIRQIDEFALLAEATSDRLFELPNGEPLHDFIVIGPVHVAHYQTAYAWRPKPYADKPSVREDWQVSTPVLYHCGCGWQVSSSWCPNCDKFATAALILSVAQGKVTANGALVEDLVVPA